MKKTHLIDKWGAVGSLELIGEIGLGRLHGKEMVWRVWKRLGDCRLGWLGVQLCVLWVVVLHWD